MFFTQFEAVRIPVMTEFRPPCDTDDHQHLVSLVYQTPDYNRTKSEFMYVIVTDLKVETPKIDRFIFPHFLFQKTDKMFFFICIYSTFKHLFTLTAFFLCTPQKQEYSQN